jgi:DNA-binding response OmpR family regulator
MNEIDDRLQIPNVLVVSSNLDAARSFQACLRGETLVIDRLEQIDGSDALSRLSDITYDLLLIDAAYPVCSRTALILHLRSRGIQIPIIGIANGRNVRERIALLDAGADDCIPFPFDLTEVGARCRAAIRRCRRSRNTGHFWRGLYIDHQAKTVTKDAKQIRLTAREWAVFSALLDKAGVVLPRWQLASQFSWSREGAACNAIDVHVSKLRRKLGEEVIQTMRGIGFCLAAGNECASTETQERPHN